MTPPEGEGIERRRYKRITTNLIARIRQSGRAEESELNTIKDVSLGGVFIETLAPFPVGTIIEFDFVIPGLNRMVSARGVVRWSNDGVKANLPRGMGVEFLEVSKTGQDAIETFVEKESAPPDPEKTQYRVRAVTELTKSSLHENLMRFYLRKEGQTFDVNILCAFFGVGRDALMMVLGDFARHNLVRILKDHVTFCPLQNEKLRKSIEEKLGS